MPRPHFTDVAPRSVLNYISNNGLSGRKYFPQPMCGGIAILDFDGDGLMDIFFTNGARFPDLIKADPSFYNRLYRNKGDGTFEDVTMKAGLAGLDLGFSFGVAAGDYDNDGWTDLFIANAGKNTLYHNNQDGTFTDVSEKSGLVKPPDVLSVQGAWFDFDNDGLLDLVVSNYTEWTSASDHRCEADGHDLYCHPNTYKNVSQRLYRNLGGGRFQDVTVPSGFGSVTGKGMGIGIADFDGDGRMDVFIANDTERNLLFLNRGDGTFKEAGLLRGVAYNDNGSTVSGMGADAKDFDNDGWPDVFYNDLMGQGWGLFRNQAGKSFQDVSPETNVARLSSAFSGWSLGFIDYNNDGWKDLYSANGDVDNVAPNARQHDTLFENIGGKTFEDVSGSLGDAFLRKGFQRGSVFVDLNNDGFLDIIVTSLQEPPRILMNSGVTGAHWLVIQAQGTRSNRDAVGTRIKVTTPSGRTLYNHVTGSVGFMSTSDLRVHFGLAGETSAASVEIRWPAGRTQTLRNVRADQILKVREPN